ncbi:MAG: helix-turn-helix domain-containing protein [Lachnospiraceae bacterium]|nr:helix-turn-helix domain-containing protein [Lachnospiraceae bacterium]
MEYMIKELRDMTGMTQKAFADMYGIPLSTLRKWEQGEATPAPYVLKLIARTLPSTQSSLQKIQGNDGEIYFYDVNKQTVADVKGNTIIIQESLEGVKSQNLALYLQDLFEGFYEIQDRFNRDCRFDKMDDILWTR